MYTVCPKCALTLVVTAADLRVAQGCVRCGRCSSVFNALARLSEERQAAALDESQGAAPEEPQQAPANPTQSTAPAPHGDDDLTDDALEFDPSRTDASALFIEPPPNPQWTAATGSFKARIAGQELTREPPGEAPREPARDSPADAQVDVEIDTDFLASMLEESSQPAGNSSPAGRAAPPPEPPARPAPAAPRQAARPADTPAPARRAATPRSEGPAASAPVAPASRSGARTTPQAAASAAARTTPAVTRPLPHARHTAPHTRPAQAALKTPPAPARAPTAPESARDPRALQTPDDAAADVTAPAEEGALAAAADGVSARALAWAGPHAWAIGAALAALVFVAQIVNHYRDELAANARFNRPLTALYSALGVQLAPHWDLHAYDVRQLGAAVDAGGSGLITVRASIKNSAQQAQPLPLLRVTLQDRFGNRIAARDVAPRFYLPHSMPASSFLSGGQRIDAEMGFVDPGANAVGFEIDACLPASGGGVACANDANAR